VVQVVLMTYSDGGYSEVKRAQYCQAIVRNSGAKRWWSLRRFFAS
jgi:hypothetical protein